MNRTIAVAVVATLALAGCNSQPDQNYPEPVPTTASPDASPSAIKSEAPVAPTREVPQDPEPTKEEPRPEPTSTTTSSDAGTPATQFAKRWGERYPNVPEYAILKAANGVCEVIDWSLLEDWTKSPGKVDLITEIVTKADMSKEDAFEFAQDADQNYCASISNPT